MKSLEEFLAEVQKAPLGPDITPEEEKLLQALHIEANKAAKQIEDIRKVLISLRGKASISDMKRYVKNWKRKYEDIRSGLFQIAYEARSSYDIRW